MTECRRQLAVADAQASTRAVQTFTGRSFHYTISTTKRLVFVRFRRTVTARDIAEYAAALRLDPGFNAGFSELVDLTEVEELSLDVEQAMDLADSKDPYSYESKRAFVTERPAMFRAARMHQVLRRSAESIAIFNSVEEAERWLEIRTSDNHQ